MNKTTKKVKNVILEQKKIYISIIILMTLGLFLGIFYALFLSKSDSTLVKNSLTTFFTEVEQNKLNYKSALMNSLIGNLSFFLFLFLLGISIVGIPIIYMAGISQSFIVGFSITSILKTYRLKGILKAFFYIFPHQVLFFLFTIFLSFYAIYFSKKLFSYLFLQREINLRHSMKRYLEVFIICFIMAIFCSFCEVFLAPLLLRHIG